jgi:hypothetical protein
VTFTFDAMVVEALALSDLPSPYLKHDFQHVKSCRNRQCDLPLSIGFCNEFLLGSKYAACLRGFRMTFRGARFTFWRKIN